MNHRHDNYGPTDTNYFCAFCGKTGDQVNAMISGPNGIYICDECISVCADAMMRDMGYAMAQEVEMLEDDPRRMGWMNPPAAQVERQASPVVDNAPSPAEVLGDLPTPHELYARLTFEPAALTAIAHEAVEHGTGARGLRSICERVLMDVMYDLPEHNGATTVTVRASDIAGETRPEIVEVADATAQVALSA